MQLQNFLEKNFMPSMQTRSLSATDPRDYLRLLFWVFFQPAQLRVYDTPPYDQSIRRVGAWLIASLFVLPWMIFSISKFNDPSARWFLGIVVLVWLLLGIVGNEGDESKLAFVLYIISILSFFGFLLWVVGSTIQQNFLLGLLLFGSYIITHFTLIWVANRTAGVIAVSVVALQAILGSATAFSFVILWLPGELFNAGPKNDEWNTDAIVRVIVLLLLIIPFIYLGLKKKRKGLLETAVNILATVLRTTSNMLREETFTLSKAILLLALFGAIATFYGCLIYVCW
jgi:hypothetical protein